MSSTPSWMLYGASGFTGSLLARRAHEAESAEGLDLGDAGSKGPPEPSLAAPGSP